MRVEEFVEKLRPMLSFGLPDVVNPYDSLSDDLAIDSIQVFEVMILTEALADCLIPPDELPVLGTFADAYEYYWRCVTEQER